MSMKRYRIKEIFGPTLQGEGSLAGTPCHFLRFAGCNKWSGRPEDKPSAVCTFCDTDFYGGRRMTVNEIMAELEFLGEVDWVVISGGEPTIQLDVDIVRKLASRWKLMVETNGSNLIDAQCMRWIEHISMSPKQAFNDTRLFRCHDLKILYPYISPEITVEKFRYFPADEIWLQPIDNDGSGKCNIEATVKECLRTGARLSLQQHKILGVK